jgi:hypothetical protein
VDGRLTRSCQTTDTELSGSGRTVDNRLSSSESYSRTGVSRRGEDTCPRSRQGLWGNHMSISPPFGTADAAVGGRPTFLDEPATVVHVVHATAFELPSCVKLGLTDEYHWRLLCLERQPATDGRPLDELLCDLSERLHSRAEAARFEWALTHLEEQPDVADPITLERSRDEARALINAEEYYGESSHRVDLDRLRMTSAGVHGWAEWRRGDERIESLVTQRLEELGALGSHPREDALRLRGATEAVGGCKVAFQRPIRLVRTCHSALELLREVNSRRNDRLDGMRDIKLVFVLQAIRSRDASVDDIPSPAPLIAAAEVSSSNLSHPRGLSLSLGHLQRESQSRDRPWAWDLELAYLPGVLERVQGNIAALDAVPRHPSPTVMPAIRPPALRLITFTRAQSGPPPRTSASPRHPSPPRRRPSAPSCRYLQRVLASLGSESASMMTSA